MKEDLIPLLSCPICHGELHWTINKRNGDHIEEAEAYCEDCAASYPVHKGIGGFLTPDLPRHDLWEEAESGLATYLREHPQIERKLLNTPLEALGPADQQYRALILEEREAYAEAKKAWELAYGGLYTSEWLACYRSQIAYVVEHLAASTGPIVDLASGQCELVEVLARELQRPIVATDFSPRVLRRDHLFLGFLGLDAQVSLLAFDARRTPFKDRAVRTLTTNLGLSNIEEPGRLLEELRRVIAGEFLVIVQFFPEDDEPNAEAIRELRLAPLLYRDSALKLFAAAGFAVELKNVQKGKARPTPKSELLDGARPDALPVAETELTWCTLVAC